MDTGVDLAARLARGRAGRRAHRRRAGLAGRAAHRRARGAAQASGRPRRGARRPAARAGRGRPARRGARRARPASASETGSPPLAAPIGQIVASQALAQRALGATATGRWSTSCAISSRARFGRTPGPDRPRARARRRAATATSASVGAGRPRHAARARPTASPRARRSCCCSRSSARRPSRCCASIRERSSGDESLAASGPRPGARRAHPRGGADRPGDGHRRDHDRGERHAGERPPHRRRAARRRPPRRPLRPAPSEARRRAAALRDYTLAAGREPDGRHVLPLARAGLAAVRRGGRRRRAGPDALHPRGDEADERGQGRGRGDRPASPRRERRSRSSTDSSSSSSSRSTAARSTRSSLMFSRVLVANRGEIAVRVIRALHELGDRGGRRLLDRRRDSLHVRMADHAVCIGPPSARESYLRIPTIVAAAETTGCQAVHPGYGFLAENPAFVEACVDNDLVFVGPPADVMATMGDKIAAKQAMRARRRADRARRRRRDDARRRRARRPASSATRSCSRRAPAAAARACASSRPRTSSRTRSATAASEAQAAFGDATLYVEKALVPARHVEIQVLCDDFGNVLTLGERECSIQRRHQKLIEESPSPALTPEAARGDGGGGRARVPRGRLPQRRHVRVPARPRRQLLLHRAERAPAGRASGHRALHRHRPRARAAADRGRRAARA